MSKVFSFICIVQVLALVACAPASGQLQITDVWARPALAGGNGAVYFTIQNESAASDTLLSASSDVAAAVELHMTQVHGGSMQMAPQLEVPIQAGRTVFEPGGLHVMLIGLQRELKPGDTFSLTLDFATAGAVPLEVIVNEP